MVPPRKKEPEEEPHSSSSDDLWLEKALGISEVPARLETTWQLRQMGRLASNPDNCPLSPVLRRPLLKGAAVWVSGVQTTEFRHLDDRGHVSEDRIETLLRIEPSIEQPLVQKKRRHVLVPLLNFNQLPKTKSLLRNRNKDWQTSYRPLPWQRPTVHVHLGRYNNNSRLFGCGETRLVVENGCPLSTCVLLRRAMMISRSYVILSIVGIGVAGRVYVPAHEDGLRRRHLLLRAYLPEESRTCELRLSLTTLEKVLGRNRFLIVAGNRSKLMDLIAHGLYFRYTLTFAEDAIQSTYEHLEEWPWTTILKVEPELCFGREARSCAAIQRAAVRRRIAQDQERLRAERRRKWLATSVRYRGCVAVYAVKIQKHTCILRFFKKSRGLSLVVTEISTLQEFHFNLTYAELARQLMPESEDDDAHHRRLRRLVPRKMRFLSHKEMQRDDNREDAIRARETDARRTKRVAVARPLYSWLPQNIDIKTGAPENLELGRRIVSQPEEEATPVAVDDEVVVVPPPKKKKTRRVVKRRHAGRGTRVCGGVGRFKDGTYAIYEVQNIGLWYDVDIYCRGSPTRTLRFHIADLKRIAKAPRRLDVAMTEAKSAAEAVATVLALDDPSVCTQDDIKLRVKAFVQTEIVSLNSEMDRAWHETVRTVLRSLDEVIPDDDDFVEDVVEGPEWVRDYYAAVKRSDEALYSTTPMSSPELRAAIRTLRTCKTLKIIRCQHVKRDSVGAWISSRLGCQLSPRQVSALVEAIERDDLTPRTTAPEPGYVTVESIMTFLRKHTREQRLLRFETCIYRKFAKLRNYTAAEEGFYGLVTMSQVHDRLEIRVEESGTCRLIPVDLPRTESRDYIRQLLDLDPMAKQVQLSIIADSLAVRDGQAPEPSLVAVVAPFDDDVPTFDRSEDIFLQHDRRVTEKYGFKSTRS